MKRFLTLLTLFISAALLTACSGSTGDTVVCGICGMQSVPTALFCSSCGNSLSTQATPTKADVTQPEHIHTYTAATCTDPAVCSCGATLGEATGHTWLVAGNCTVPKTCVSCGVTESAPGHSWKGGTCTDPKTCTVCGATEGSAGHSWQDATCTDPKTCTVCGATEGAPSPHYWVLSSCDVPKVCFLCGMTEGAPAGHNWLSATCLRPQTCSVCQLTEGVPLPHSHNSDKKCTVCGLGVNGERLLRWLKEKQDAGIPVTAADAAEALEIDVRSVDGIFTAAIQRNGLGTRTPAEIKQADGTTKQVKYLELTDAGRSYLSFQQP